MARRQYIVALYRIHISVDVGSQSVLHAVAVSQCHMQSVALVMAPSANIMKCCKNLLKCCGIGNNRNTPCPPSITRHGCM